MFTFIGQWVGSSERLRCANRKSERRGSDIQNCGIQKCAIRMIVLETPLRTSVAGRPASAAVWSGEFRRLHESPGAFDDLDDTVVEISRGDGFQKRLGDSGIARGLDAPQLGVRGDHNDRNPRQWRRAIAANQFDEAYAVHRLHVVIAQHEVRLHRI